MSPLKSLIAAAVFALAAMPSLAQAATPDGYETMSVRVMTEDLNLYTEAGAKAFLKRVDRAVDRACGGRPAYGPGMEGPRRHYRECRAEATQSAVMQADSLIVNTVFAERSGRIYALASR
jgi:UrcA family protein